MQQIVNEDSAPKVSVSSDNNDSTEKQTTEGEGGGPTRNDARAADALDTARPSHLVVQNFDQQLRTRFRETPGHCTAKCVSTCTEMLRGSDIPVQFNEMSGFLDGFGTDTKVIPGSANGCAPGLTGMLLVIELKGDIDERRRNILRLKGMSDARFTDAIAIDDDKKRLLPFVIMDVNDNGYGCQTWSLFPWPQLQCLVEFFSEHVTVKDVKTDTPYDLWSVWWKKLSEFLKNPASVKPSYRQTWDDKIYANLLRFKIVCNDTFGDENQKKQRYLFEAFHFHAYVGPPQLHGYTKFLTPAQPIKAMQKKSGSEDTAPVGNKAQAGGPAAAGRENTCRQGKKATGGPGEVVDVEVDVTEAGAADPVVGEAGGADAGAGKTRETDAGGAAKKGRQPKRRKTQSLEVAFRKVAEQYSLTIQNNEKCISEKDYIKFMLMHPEKFYGCVKNMPHAIRQMLEDLESMSGNDVELLQCLAFKRLEDLGDVENSADGEVVVKFSNPGPIIEEHYRKTLRLEFMKLRGVKQFDEGEWAKATFDVFGGNSDLLVKPFYTSAFQRYMDGVIQKLDSLRLPLTDEDVVVFEGSDLLDVILQALVPDQNPASADGGGPAAGAGGSGPAAGAGGSGPAAGAGGSGPAAGAGGENEAGPDDSGQISHRSATLLILSDYFLLYMLKGDYTLPTLQAELELYLRLITQRPIRGFLNECQPLTPLIFRCLVHAAETSETREEVLGGKFGPVIRQLANDYCLEENEWTIQETTMDSLQSVLMAHEKEQADSAGKGKKKGQAGKKGKK